MKLHWLEISKCTIILKFKNFYYILNSIKVPIYFVNCYINVL